MIITAPISVGELVDKLTILLIKLEHITDDNKRRNVQTEFDMLDAILRDTVKMTSQEKGIELITLTSRLKEINSIIWRVEDDIREHESRQDFGQSFIKLARNVYQFNDRRARIKREINDLFESTIKEEKLYKRY